MLDDAIDFYEQHCDDCVGWGIPRPKPWCDLSPEDRAGWEQQASEHAKKMLEDRKETE